MTGSILTKMLLKRRLLLARKKKKNIANFCKNFKATLKRLKNHLQNFLTDIQRLQMTLCSARMSRVRHNKRLLKRWALFLMSRVQYHALWLKKNFCQAILKTCRQTQMLILTKRQNVRVCLKRQKHLMKARWRFCQTLMTA